MKTKTKLTGGLLLGMVLSAVCLIAVAKPSSAPNDNDKLNQSIALFKQGKYAEAHAALTNLPANSPVHGQAKAYDALCRYAQGDQKKFLSTLESPEIQTVALPDDVREDLDFKQIDALMYYRKFEEALAKAEKFTRQHANSPRVGAMAEYQLAGLYEKGMKKMAESVQSRTLGDVAEADRRLHEGQDNLGQFLKLTANGQMDSYQSLTDRDLSAEVVKTMAALGGEDEAVKMVPTAKREDMALSLVLLHKKIDSDADATIGRMTNFLGQFPKSKHNKRLMYEMANVAVEEGYRLTWKAKQGKAVRYLDMARDLFSGMTADKEAGISDYDVMESKIGAMRVFYAKQDYAGLSNWVAQIITNLPSGDKQWLSIKLYDAAGLACQNKAAESAKELDELLAIGFKGNPSYDGPLVSAAEWRIRVAKMTGDEVTVQRIVQLVQNSNCYDSLKRTFATDYKQLATSTDPLKLLSK